MTDKRTKADLLDEIERLKEAVKSKTIHIAKLNEDNRLIEDRADHYMREAERLSEVAQGLEKDLETVREKHGDLVVDAQTALMTVVDVMRTVRPRLERDISKSARDEIYRHGFDAKDTSTSVRPFERLPF